MMKRGLTISTIVLSSLLSLPTMALMGKSTYVSAQVGAAIPSGKLNHETSFAPTPFKRAATTAAVFDICGGVEVYKNSYAELELAYAQHQVRHNYVDTTNSSNESFRAKFRTMTGFANLSYRFNNLNSFIVPYITAGAGISSNRVGGITISDPANRFYAVSRGKTATNAAWQIGAGALMKLTKMVSVNFSYKYRHLGNVKTTNIIQNSTNKTQHPFLQGKVRTHNILLGVAVDL